MRPALLIAALLPLPAAAEGLRIADAWTRTGGDEAAAVFMTIRNAGPEIAVLKGAETPGGGMALVAMAPAHPLDEAPETLDGIGIVPDLEVLLHGLDVPRGEGERLPVTLFFEPQGPLEIKVEAADATGPSAAGD